MSTVSPSSDQQLDRAALAALYEETFKNLEEGTITEGRVVAVTKDKVVVDIGYKSEGMIPNDQFSTEELQNIKVGDRLQVYIEECEDADGNLVLSKEKADKMKIWEELEKLFNDGKSIDGKIVARIKGGMMVDIGVKAFLPGSQIDLHPVRDLDGLVGRTFPLKIIKINHRRGNVVVSRRVLLEETRDSKRKTTLSTLKEGQLIQGVVKNITDYGAFIDLGGIDGLLHITDMSWGRVGHPSELFKVNDEIDVIVLKYDSATERVSLGHKQLITDPWANVMERYPVGARMSGKVVSLTDYGAFVELEAGVEGLIHVSEMSWSKRVKHPSKILNVGDTVDAMVLGVDPTARRISLGLKQLEPNPFASLKEKYPPGTVVKGVIRNIADFGIFVEIEEGIDGLVHVSDLSWTQRGKHPSELYQKGDEVESVVLNIDFDGEKPKVSLGIKQLVPDPWDRIPYDYPVGKIVEAKVIKVLDFGAFVEIEKGVEGLIHVSEFADERIEDPKAFVKVGQSLKAEIIGVDTAERKIGLSFRGALRAEELADAQGFTGGVPTATLGDVMREKLADLTG